MPVKAFLLLSLMLFSSLLQAATQTVDGKTLATRGNGQGAAPCMSCHGADGMGNPSAGYPYLAAQPAAYLKNQLQAFKSGERRNPVMNQMAKTLTDPQIQALAEYYSKMNNRLIKGANALAADRSSNASTLMFGGRWSVGLPACTQCHGEQGKGVGEHFPAIVGLPSQYISGQLKAWKEGTRHNDPIGLMQAVSARLSAEDIHDISVYLSTLNHQ